MNQVNLPKMSDDEVAHWLGHNVRKRFQEKGPLTAQDMRLLDMQISICTELLERRRALPPEGREQEWISVKDRMPTNGEVVLIAGEKNLYVTGVYDDGGWWGWSSRHEEWSAGLPDSLITHWMPRPKHPSSPQSHIRKEGE